MAAGYLPTCVCSALEPPCCREAAAPTASGGAEAKKTPEIRKKVLRGLLTRHPLVCQRVCVCVCDVQTQPPLWLTLTVNIQQVKG